MRSLKVILVAALAVLAAPAATQGPAPQPTLDVQAETATTSSPRVVETPAPEDERLTRADVEAWLDGFMSYALPRGDVAGAVVVVVKDGETLFQKGYGYADVGARRPVDPEATLFRPGSVSKLFTWTAVMQLVEEGKLDLDRDVNAYLDFKIPPREGEPITLRDIMTHTAGFEETIRGLITADPEGVSPLGEVMKAWVPERIFAAGTTPAYSNYATALAGYIVERVSGMSFDDYVDRTIFQPLGMTRSSFRQPLPERLRPLMSKGYALGSGDPKPYEMIGPAPAGSLASTGADMAKFMIAHLNQGGPLLEPQTARMMHGTTLDMVPPLNRMALGFYEQDINGHDVVAHGGDTQWFHSYLWLFPEQDVGLYVSVNSAGRDGAAGAIRTSLFDQFADRYFPPDQPVQAQRVEAETAAEHARMMVGTYTNSRRADSSFFKALGLVGQMKIGLDADGGLAIDFLPSLGGAPREWVEIAPFVWRDAHSHELMAAEVVDGEVVRLSFGFISPFMMFEPAPWYLSSAWLLPALLAGLAVLVVTALSWPTGWAARRRYGAKLAFTGNDLKAYRLVRGFSALAALVLIGWAVAIGAMMSDMSLLSGQLDGLVWLLQITGWIAFLGLFGIALWNLWLVWKGKRGWFSKLWSVLILLAALVVLWVAVGFNLLDFGTNY